MYLEMAGAWGSLGPFVLVQAPENICMLGANIRQQMDWQTSDLATTEGPPPTSTRKHVNNCD